MSDNVLTILIICITVVIVFIIFRNKLSGLSIIFKELKLNAAMKKNQPSGINMERFKIKGNGNKIDAKGSDISFKDITLNGENLEIKAKTHNK